MKVIFIEDVPDVALAGESREVADGYGRNYLLPKRLAVLANSAASNIVEAQMKKVLVKRAQAAAEMTELAGKLNGMEFTIKARVGEKERLYGSVTSADIADEVKNSAGLDIDRRKIEMAEPIRELGIYEVTVRFSHDIAAAIRLTVEADRVAEEKTEEPETKKRKPRAKKAAEAESEVDEAEAEVAEAEVKVEEAEDKVEETEDKVEETEDKVEETEDKVEEAEAEIEEAEAEIEEAGAEIEEAGAEIEEAGAEIEEAEDKVEETEAKETAGE